MPKLTIDGREIEVAPGTNLIEAARQLDVHVPYYCYHPALEVAASCRMCQVELHDEGKPARVIVACQTRAADGMNVVTQGADCRQARASTLEFLLANHPLDCPICDKAGECSLQDFSYRHGNAQGRFTEKKREGAKRESIGNHILLDQERCILCTRCVRFMDEVAHDPALVVTGRGDRNVISIFPGQPIDSNYEGNLADICPVGALTLKEFRFKSRVWDLTSTDSACTRCDRNCSITLDTKRNALLRVRPRENPQVQGHFLCDIGRFGLLEDLAETGRVTGARSALGSPDAEPVAALAQRLEEHRGRLLVVLSGRLTNEDVLQARAALGGVVAEQGLVFVPVTEDGADDILFTGRRAANESGLRALGIATLDEAALGRRLAENGITAALFLDAALAERCGARSSVSFLAVCDTWVSVPAGQDESARPADADLFLPGRFVAEKDGTLINFEQVLQRVRRALSAPSGTFHEGELFDGLRAALGTDGEPADGPDRTADVCRALGIPALTLARVPALGLKLDQAREVVSS